MANRASDGGNHMYGHVLIELSELNMLSGENPAQLGNLRICWSTCT
jgi:hypothetical protein